jgi:hypothetical protein
MTRADEYRKRAAAILKKTKVRLTAAGREKLTHKAQGLLEQADNQDWLEGKSVVRNGTDEA